jgi:hypothetical protein
VLRVQAYRALLDQEEDRLGIKSPLKKRKRVRCSFVSLARQFGSHAAGRQDNGLSAEAIRSPEFKEASTPSHTAAKTRDSLVRCSC